MNESQSNSFLAEQPVGALMRKFSLPCILSLLVGALYNIVDQLFIANASYLGSYGNAANSVVFPLTVIALAIATMIGDGCCAYVSIRLGAGEPEQAHRSVGNAIVLTLIVSVVLTAVYLIFMDPILTAFGATVNAETFALSREYCFWIALGIPFYMFGQAMNPIIHHSLRRQPALRHAVAAGGRGVQHHPRPHLHLPVRVGHDGRGHRDGHRPDPLGRAGGGVSAAYEGRAAAAEQLPAAG